MPDTAASRPFLGRFEDPLVIRARGSYRAHSARRVDTGEGCLVVTPGAKADPQLVGAAYEEIERTHALISHPRIARVAGRGTFEGVPFLEFAFPAIADGLDIMQMLSDQGIRQPYAPADSFIASLRVAMEAAHGVTDPRTGEPLCLGRIGLANAFFTANGEWALVGYGRNFPLERDDGSLDPAVSFFQAPELGTGGRPTPEGDYVALLLLMRSLLPWVDMSGPVGRILRGEIEPSDFELIECLQWVEENMVGCLPSRRAPLAEAVRVGERIRELQGSARDEPGYAAFLRELFARAEEPAPLEEAGVPSALTLTVGPDAQWISAPDGSRHRLGRAHRRIMLALVERHRADSTGALTLWNLLAAGWPGEEPVADSGANRVYVALTRLRQLGLREVIERFDDGYRIAPSTIVRREA